MEIAARSERAAFFYTISRRLNLSVDQTAGLVAK